MAAQAVRWPGVLKVARSYLSQCSKSCDLQPALNCAIRGAQGVLLCVGWGQVALGALVSYRYTCAPYCCRISQYRRIFIYLSVSRWNNHIDPVLEGVVLTGFKSRANDFYGPKLLDQFSSSTVVPFLFFLSRGWYYGAGVFRLIGCKSLSPGLALPSSFKNK